jgi:hypothetical protein
MHGSASHDPIWQLPGLMRIIALPASAPYLGQMVSAVLKILTLMALAYMPLGMAPAGATPGAHPAAVESAISPCQEHQAPGGLSSGPAVHCTACTALPAMEAAFPATQLRPQPRMDIRSRYFVSGIEPEVATPPPKYS